MSNMIDIYLSMNSCVRDKTDNVYYIEMNKKPQLLGKITGHSIKGSTLSIDITTKPKVSVDFISIDIKITKDYKVEDAVD